MLIRAFAYNCGPVILYLFFVQFLQRFLFLPLNPRSSPRHMFHRFYFQKNVRKISKKNQKLSPRLGTIDIGIKVGSRLNETPQKQFLALDIETLVETVLHFTLTSCYIYFSVINFFARSQTRATTLVTKGIERWQRHCSCFNFYPLYNPCMLCCKLHKHISKV